MEKKIDISKNSKVSIVWNVNPSDYTKEKEKNIKTLFSQKYDIPENNIIIEKKFIVKTTNADSGLNSENIKEITDPAFQQKLFKIYFDENEITDFDFNEIIKIDSTVNSLINYDEYKNHKRYTLKWLDWSNFLSYGKTNHFDFTTLHGLILLNGEPANKSGKSTFAYDLLHFLFFGETKSGKAKNESGQFNLGALFNSFLPEETELKVEGCINIEGNDYIIRRTLKRPAKSKKELRTATQKVEYFKVLENGELDSLEDSINLQETTTKQTNKIIKEAIGNERDFDLIISASAKDLDELISLKNDERGKLLSRWIGLSCLEEKNLKAKEIWSKKISVGRYCDTYNRETLNVEIKNLTEENKTINEEITKSTEKLSACEKRIKQCQEDKERYLSEKKPVDETLSKVGDVTTMETKLETLKNQGIEKANLLKTLKENLKGFVDIDFSEEKYKAMSVKNNQLIEQIATIKTTIKSLQEQNKTLANSEYCPTCHRKYENVDNSELIQTNKKKIEELTNNGILLNNEKNELVKQIENEEQKRKNLFEKNKLELRISAIETEIANLRIAYQDVKNTIKKLNDNKEAIKYNGELDAKINVMTETIKVEETIKNNLTTEINQYKYKIGLNDKSIEDKENIILKINDEEKIEKNWKLYLKVIGKDGISKMVLRNSLPVINAEINRLLTGVSDFEVEVVMNEKNDVNFYLIRDNIKYNLSAASGLEKTQAALALRVVLGNMSTLCRPNFILLDEVLGCVAEENYDDMKKLYDKIVSNFDFVFHICHLPQIMFWHDGVVKIQKINNISSIKEVQACIV